MNMLKFQFRCVPFVQRHDYSLTCKLAVLQYLLQYKYKIIISLNFLCLLCPNKSIDNHNKNIGVFTGGQTLEINDARKK